MSRRQLAHEQLLLHQLAHSDAPPLFDREGVRNEAMAKALGALDQAVHRAANVDLYGEVSAW